MNEFLTTLLQAVLIAAVSLAQAQAKNLLTVEAMDYLHKAYGDLNKYLTSRIEAEVRNQKQGMVTLATGV